MSGSAQPCFAPPLPSWGPGGCEGTPLQTRGLGLAGPVQTPAPPVSLVGSEPLPCTPSLSVFGVGMAVMMG